MRRVIVIGAGPIGVAAALGAIRRGGDVRVLEADVVGGALRRWGPTRLFTPMSINLSDEMYALLRAQLPPPRALLTGPEFVDAILRPLVARAPLRGRVSEGCRVRAIRKSETGFLVDVGSEEIAAEVVIDASGTYGQPQPFFDAVPGVIRDLGALDRRRADLAGRRLLLVGHGYSAANALLVLADLAREAPDTRVLWWTRSPALRPIFAWEPEPLPERARVVTASNDLAEHPPAWLTIGRSTAVRALHVDAAGAFVAWGGGADVSVDAVIALTGYRPDLSTSAGLGVAVDPLTEGTAGLARALSRTDWTTEPVITAADLASGVPGFHVVGAKSYGRARTFLLHTGYQQLTAILDRL